MNENGLNMFVDKTTTGIVESTRGKMEPRSTDWIFHKLEENYGQNPNVLATLYRQSEREGGESVWEQSPLLPGKIDFARDEAGLHIVLTTKDQSQHEVILGSDSTHNVWTFKNVLFGTKATFLETRMDGKTYVLNFVTDKGWYK